MRRKTTPTLRVVKPPKAKPKGTRARAAKSTATSFPQRAGASAKQLLVFELLRARAAVHAALQGLHAAHADRPLAQDKWSAREHVLHLCHWDDEVLRAMEPALRGIAPRWAGFDAAATDAFNAEGVRGLAALSWGDAERLLLSRRMSLMDEVEAVPEDQADVWSPDHPFGAMLADLAWNDRHHAEAIKSGRAERGT